MPDAATAGHGRLRLDDNARAKIEASTGEHDHHMTRGVWFHMCSAGSRGTCVSEEYFLSVGQGGAYVLKTQTSTMCWANLALCHFHLRKCAGDLALVRYSTS